MSQELAFDSLPDSKETVYIKKAGIHLGFVLSEVEFTPPKEKDGVKTSGASIKFTFKNEKNELFQSFVFEPATRIEDVKYTGDVYENGVKVRKRTEAEQINAEFVERFYLFEQLAKAWGGAKEKFDSFKNSVKAEPDKLFKIMYEKFFSVYTKDFYGSKKINIKLVFANNDKKQTSYLGLAKPSASNLVFAPYTTEASPILQMSQYEEKNSIRKYSPQEKAPVSNSAEASEGWKPVATTDAPDGGNDDLF